MVEGKVGDRLVLESRRTGQAAREGEILEVLGAGEGVHYRVRWMDGHESTNRSPTLPSTIVGPP